MSGSWQASRASAREALASSLAVCRGSTPRPPRVTLSEANEVWLQCLSVVFASLGSPNQKHSACSSADGFLGRACAPASAWGSTERWGWPASVTDPGSEILVPKIICWK